jgi:hypothetical protein
MPVTTVLLFGLRPDDLDVSPTLQMPRSIRPGADRAAALDREHVLDGHEERLVDLALRIGM